MNFNIEKTEIEIKDKNLEYKLKRIKYNFEIPNFGIILFLKQLLN